MTKSYFYINLDRSSRADDHINKFVKRFEGREVVISKNYNLEDDGVHIYEVPPGIVIIKRPQVMKGQGTITRYDVLGADNSEDGRQRKQALEHQLDEILHAKGE